MPINYQYRLRSAGPQSAAVNLDDVDRFLCELAGETYSPTNYCWQFLSASTDVLPFNPAETADTPTWLASRLRSLIAADPNAAETLMWLDPLIDRYVFDCWRSRR